MRKRVAVVINVIQFFFFFYTSFAIRRTKRFRRKGWLFVLICHVFRDRGRFCSTLKHSNERKVVYWNRFRSRVATNKPDSMAQMNSFRELHCFDERQKKNRTWTARTFFFLWIGTAGNLFEMIYGATNYSLYKFSFRKLLSFNSLIKLFPYSFKVFHRLTLNPVFFFFFFVKP